MDDEKFTTSIQVAGIHGGNGFPAKKPHQLPLLIFYCQFHEKLLNHFSVVLSKIYECLRDHFATSLTFSWTAAESRVTGSLVKECDLYVQIFCMFLYVLLNIIKKLSFLKCPYLCLQSKFYKTHVSVSFFFFKKAEEQLQNTLPLIYMSLNKNNVYCVIPRSLQPSDTCN